jgi:gas vesicle protein
MSKLLWGFTLGLITGLLLAPDKGSETRAHLQRKANDLKNKFDDFVDSVSEKFESYSDEVIETENISRRSRPFASETQNGIL